MKFVKGMILGGMIVGGAYMMYNEKMFDPKRLAKRGRKIARKIGMI